MINEKPKKKDFIPKLPLRWSVKKGHHIYPYRMIGLKNATDFNFVRVLENIKYKIKFDILS